MDKNLESAYTPDLYNTFVDTPESDIPESLRDSVFLDAKKDPAFKRLFGDARLVCDVIKYILQPPKQILERQARDMIPSTMIADLINEAVDRNMKKSRRFLRGTFTFKTRVD